MNRERTDMKLKTRKRIRTGVAMLLVLTAAIAFAACSGTNSSESGESDSSVIIEDFGGPTIEENDVDDETDDYYGYGPDDEVIMPDIDAGDLVIVMKNGKYGALNEVGEQTLPYEYDYIEYVAPDRYIVSRSKETAIVNSRNEEIAPFGKYIFEVGQCNDYASEDVWIDRIAAKDCESGKWGYYSAEDNAWAIEPKFRRATPFPYEASVAAVKDQNDIWGFINTEGEYVIRPKYKKLNLDSFYGFTGEAVSAVTEEGKTVYVMGPGKETTSAPTASQPSVSQDWEGDVPLSPDEYVDIVCVDYNYGDEGTAEDDVAFAAMKNGDWGYSLYNKNGKRLGKKKYDKVYSFASYPDEVYICAFEKNGKIGFMDKKGKTVLKPTFAAHEGAEITYDPEFWSKDFGIIPDKKTDKYAVIDKDFNLITDYQFKDFGGAGHGLLAASDGKKWCVINTEGEEVLPYGEYEEIDTIFSNGMILVEDSSSGKAALFNSEGKQVTEFKYEVEDSYC